MNNPKTIPIKVEHIKEEMRIDLESCPYLSDHPSAPYEYATVDYIKRETADCVAIGYEGIGGSAPRMGPLTTPGPRQRRRASG